MKILVVEDNLLIALSLQQNLELWGHEVILAHSPDDAVSSASERRPELVLMDIDLASERDGVDTMVAIVEAVGPVPNIYLTGFAFKETQQKTLLTDPFGYVEKPVWPEELRALIAGVEERSGR